MKLARELIEGHDVAQKARAAGLRPSVAGCMELLVSDISISPEWLLVLAEAFAGLADLAPLANQLREISRRRFAQNRHRSPL